MNGADTPTAKITYPVSQRQESCCVGQCPRGTVSDRVTAGGRMDITDIYIVMLHRRYATSKVWDALRGGK